MKSFSDYRYFVLLDTIFCEFAIKYKLVKTISIPDEDKFSETSVGFMTT